MRFTVLVLMTNFVVLMLFITNHCNIFDVIYCIFSGPNSLDVG